MCAVLNVCFLVVMVCWELFLRALSMFAVVYYWLLLLLIVSVCFRMCACVVLSCLFRFVLGYVCVCVIVVCALCFSCFFMCVIVCIALRL